MANRKIGRELKKIPVENRLNPKVIRSFLHEWVTDDFDRDVVLASMAVADSQRDSGRNYKSSLKGETIYDILLDRCQIRYVHLDGLAKLFGVPTSLILIFTRIRAELEQDSRDLGKAISIVDSMQICLDKIKSDIAALGAQDQNNIKDITDFFHYRNFKTLIDLYKLSAEQPSLL